MSTDPDFDPDVVELGHDVEPDDVVVGDDELLLRGDAIASHTLVDHLHRDLPVELPRVGRAVRPGHCELI